MRALLLVAGTFAAACGPPGGACDVDGDCGGDDVCARTQECLSRSEVQTVRITWTVRGQPASATTCASSPRLYLLFYGFSANDYFGYEPVTCDAGLFTIDKLPTRYRSVEIGETGGFMQEKAIDSTGTVSFDLMP